MPDIAADSQAPLYWLHIPITAPRGDLLGPDKARVVVLGKTARLHTREPFQRAHGAVSPTAVHQWLLFDPMTRADAESVFHTFCARLPALSLRMRASFRIGPYKKLEEARGELYNGPMPSLIASEHTPTPTWGEISITNEKQGWQDWLETCPAVNDPRLIAALDLYVSAKDDPMPRSQFLTYLTILDSLAPTWRRPPSVAKWIDDRFQDPVVRADQALGNALRNLKNVSHGKAVRELVGRAALANGLDTERVKVLKASAGDLYSVRSNLSHAGNTEVPNVKAACDLVALVLEQAVLDASILDVKDEEDPDPAS
ncbi:hypothetical protein [Burkholderia glumae]|uniref:hypothetical protein n=1 Tax=Burkholderia glumae TaxID=337 RepID=UPI002150BFEE|nr:hypothetical protein [Burkholderia glumae]